LLPSFPPRIERAAAGHAEGESRLDASPVVESRLRADPPGDQVAGSAAPGGVAVFRCDFCAAGCAKSERRRLIWETESDGELVLADLCPRCASEPDWLLETYGRRGGTSLRVTRPATAATGFIFLRRTSSVVVSAAVYLLIALATFFVVTLITARH
jgi:hypothetical protein